MERPTYSVRPKLSSRKKSLRRPRPQLPPLHPPKAPSCSSVWTSTTIRLPSRWRHLDTTEVRRYGIIGGEHDDVLKLVKKLQAAPSGTLLKFCYEPGRGGLRFCRCLRAHGLDCILVCPSKVRAKPGERVRPTGGMPTNWRGCIARRELTGIYVPEPERMRRCGI